MNVLAFETCWATKNKKKWHQLVYLYSTTKMMHGPINVRSYRCLRNATLFTEADTPILFMPLTAQKEKRNKYFINLPSTPTQIDTFQLQFMSSLTRYSVISPYLAPLHPSQQASRRLSKVYTHGCQCQHDHFRSGCLNSHIQFCINLTYHLSNTCP